MTPPPMRQRILGALALAPMTLATLAKCLGTTPGYVRNVVDTLRDEGRAIVVYSERGPTGRPPNWWGLPQ